MWLGMLAGAAGQLPWLPAAPLTALAGICAAFIAQVAHWFAAPVWAELDAPLTQPWAVAAVYGALLSAAGIATRWGRTRAALRPRAARWPALVAIAALALGLAGPALLGGTGSSAPEVRLRVRVLDVGQGDAILLQPRRADPVLVDAGPPGSDVPGRLRELGVERLAALVVTHADSDHAGGVEDVLARVEVETLAIGARAPAIVRAAVAAGTRVARVAAGSAIESGRLRLEVLWPARPLLDEPRPDEPNAASVVVKAEWGRFDLLLPGDGEAEAVPLDPGPVDVLKVAHHGSEDAGLDALLERTAPRLALISVGAGNPYGHPTRGTLETLADHGVAVLRTDTSGEVSIGVTAGAWSVLPDE